MRRKETNLFREFHLGKGYCSPNDIKFDEAKAIPFGNSILYASQARGPDGPYVVVPGYKRTEVTSDRSVMVEPISDEAEQKVISKLLKGLFEGHFVFW